MKKGKRFNVYFNYIALAAHKHKKEILKITSKIIDRGIFLNGKENNKLEKKLSSIFKNGYIATTNSGHDSILIALSALKLKKDDEVIFPVNAYPTAFPIHISHAKLVPVDVDENGQIDPWEIKKKLNSKTRVIIVVHLYGLVGSLAEILKIAKENKITLMEDCAQAFGTKFQKKQIGTFGDISCLSFYPTKILGTMGDGGAIWTKHKNIYEFIQKAKSYGESKKYYSEFVFGHSRLPEIQAGILNVYLKTILKRIERRIEIRKYYEQAFAKKGLSPFVRTLKSHPDSSPDLHLFVIEVEKRDELVKFLARKKIEIHIHYPYPVHLIPAFSYLGYKKGDFPMAERLSKRKLSLPFHSFLSKKEIDYIIKSIGEFYKNNARTKKGN